MLNISIFPGLQANNRFFCDFHFRTPFYCKILYTFPGLQTKKAVFHDFHFMAPLYCKMFYIFPRLQTKNQFFMIFSFGHHFTVKDYFSHSTLKMLCLIQSVTS